MRTYATKAGDIQRRWVHFDAAGQTLGRLAAQVATVLSGKRKTVYSPHLDVGDYVIVTNADKIRVTGDKLTQKRYYRHSGYPGGFREVMLRDVLRHHPTRVIEHAVRGMLPRNRLGAAMIRKLKVYAGLEHPHEAQKPVDWSEVE